MNWLVEHRCATDVIFLMEVGTGHIEELISFLNSQWRLVYTKKLPITCQGFIHSDVKHISLVFFII